MRRIWRRSEDVQLDMDQQKIVRAMAWCPSVHPRSIAERQVQLRRTQQPRLRQTPDVQNETVLNSPPEFATCMRFMEVPKKSRPMCVTQSAVKNIACGVCRSDIPYSVTCSDFSAPFNCVQTLRARTALVEKLLKDCRAHLLKRSHQYQRHDLERPRTFRDASVARRQVCKTSSDQVCEFDRAVTLLQAERFARLLLAVGFCPGWPCADANGDGAAPVPFFLFLSCFGFFFSLFDLI